MENAFEQIFRLFTTLDTFQTEQKGSELLENKKPINKLPEQEKKSGTYEKKEKNHVLNAMRMYFITSTILI